MDSDEDHGYTKPKIDQGSFNYTLSQAGTSYAGSMAGTERSRAEDEDNKTTVSTFSYRSDRDAAKFLRQVEGRTVNAISEQYLLPTDSEEFNRLDKQHTAIVLGLNGKLFPMAEQVQALLQGEGKKILDLGCGTGVWTTAMANEFPEASVVGVDLAPTPIESENMPQNCRFEVDDANLGLSHFENEVDLLHMRLVGAGLKDFKRTLRDIALSLKPGGMAIIMDIDYDLYSGHKFDYLPVASELEPSGAWLQRPIYEMRRSVVLGGSDVHTMEAEMDKGLWDNPFFDPETCKTASLYLPLGPWAKSTNSTQAQYLKFVGALMRQDIQSGHRAVHPLLIRSGWTKETVNEWSDKADQELSSMRDQVSLRIRLAWGRRRAGEGLPAPPLPPLTQSADEHSNYRGTAVPYPFFYVYNSQEESLAAAAKRNAPKPQVQPIHPAIKQ